MRLKTAYLIPCAPGPLLLPCVRGRSPERGG